MLEQGFIDEVVALRERSDLHAGLPSIRAVGYRQVWDYLDGKLTSAEMQERGIIATRQLSKRQFTWLRSWTDLHSLDSLDCDNLPGALKYLGTISIRSEEHTPELQSLMRISYAVFCLTKKIIT